MLTIRKRSEEKSETTIVQVDKSNFSPNGHFFAVGLHNKTIVILENRNDEWVPIKEEKNLCEEMYDNLLHRVHFIGDKTCVSCYNKTITVVNCLPGDDEIVTKKFESLIKDVCCVDENCFFITTYQGQIYACRKNKDIWTFDLIKQISREDNFALVPSKDGRSCALIVRNNTIHILHDTGNELWDYVKEIQNPNPAKSVVDQVSIASFEDGMLMIRRNIKEGFSKYKTVCYDLATDRIMSRCKGDDSIELELHPSLELILVYIALSKYRRHFDYNVLKLSDSELVNALPEEQQTQIVEKIITMVRKATTRKIQYRLVNY